MFSSIVDCKKYKGIFFIFIAGQQKPNEATYSWTFYTMKIFVIINTD